MKTATNANMPINAKGFSLIELMIVVAIIGLLAAIGIPQYAKFQAKARQSEAKGHLTMIFTSETSFQSEWNAFSSDLFDMGVAATGTNLRYSSGFNAVCTPLVSAVNANAPAEQAANLQLHLLTVSPAASANWFSVTLFPTGSIIALNGAPNCTNTLGSQAFIASATGDPRNSPDAAISGSTDTWTINQQKRILNTVPGI